MKFAAGSKRAPLNLLTPRERVVLEGIAEGLNNAESAAALKPSVKTVFDKVRVEHRYQAIVPAREPSLGRAISLFKQG